MDFANDLWAIRPDSSELRALMLNRRSDAPANAEHTRQRAARQLRPRTSGRIAVIPIYGVISQRPSRWGGTSTQQLSEVLHVASQEASGIVLDVDSPGGTVPGVQELSDQIHALAKKIPIYAISNSENASAAYWLSSQATRLYAARGSYTGSIGVFRMHMDYSGALEKEGVRVTFISTPEYKVEGNPYEPISTEAVAFDQSQIDDVYEDFVNDVARGRGVTPSRVRTSFGKGRMFGAEQAKAVGLTDGVKSLAEVLGALVGRDSHRAGISGSTSRLMAALDAAWGDSDTSPHAERRARLNRSMLGA